MSGRPAVSGDADYLRGWNAATDPLAKNRSMTPGKGLNLMTPGSRFPAEAIRRLEASVMTTHVTADRESYFIQQHVKDLIRKHDAGRLTRGEWDELARRLRFA